MLFWFEHELKIETNFPKKNLFLWPFTKIHVHVHTEPDGGGSVCVKGSAACVWGASRACHLKVFDQLNMWTHTYMTQIAFYNMIGFYYLFIKAKDF